MLYSTDDIINQINQNLQLQDVILNKINKRRKEAQRSLLLSVKIIAVALLITSCILLFLKAGLFVIVLPAALIIPCVIYIILSPNYAPMSKTTLDNPYFIKSMNQATYFEFKEYFDVQKKLYELSKIHEKILVSKKTCPKCGTSILAESIYVGENNENIYMYNCQQCHYEFRENMHVGEQSIKVGASV